MLHEDKVDQSTLRVEIRIRMSRSFSSSKNGLEFVNLDFS
jgi:hypothetical protein